MLNAQEKHTILLILGAAIFMDLLDVTVTVTAIPMMAQDFQIDPIYLRLAISSYLMMFAILTPISGWLADRFGTFRTLKYAIAMFTISSLFCGYARHIETLVLARVLQGVGGALITPLARLAALQIFPKNEIVRANNTLASMIVLGPALGPVIGGFICSRFSWPFVFFINIPFGIFLILLLHRLTQKIKIDPIGKDTKPFDVLGFLLLVFVLTPFAVWCEIVSENAYSLELKRALLWTSFFSSLVYGLWYYRRGSPWLDMSVLKNRLFCLGFFSNAIVRLHSGSVFMILSLLVQMGLSYTATYSGIVVATVSFGIFLSKKINVFLYQTFGFKKVCLCALFLLALNLECFHFIGSMPEPLIVLIFSTYGFCFSTLASAFLSFSFHDLPPSRLTQASSLYFTGQFFTTGLSFPFITSVLDHYLGDHVSTPWPLEAFSNTFSLMALMVGASAFLLFWMKDEDAGESSGHHRIKKTFAHVPED